MEWTDCTTYRQNQKNRKPTAFETKAGNLSILITCNHIYYPNEWILRTTPKIVDMYSLNLASSVSVKRAQQKAISIIKRNLNNILKNLK